MVDYAAIATVIFIALGILAVWKRIGNYVDLSVEEAERIKKIDSRTNVYRRIQKAEKQFGKDGLPSWDDLGEMCESSFKRSE